MATYTVFVPAPAGHTGVLPVTIAGSDEKGNAVHHSMKIPYGEKVEGVPEPVAKYLESNHDAKITKEKDSAATGKKKDKPESGTAGGGEGATE